MGLKFFYHILSRKTTTHNSFLLLHVAFTENKLQRFINNCPRVIRKILIDVTNAFREIVLPKKRDFR